MSATCCSRTPPAPRTGAAVASGTGVWTATAKRAAAAVATHGNGGDGSDAGRDPTGCPGNTSWAGEASGWSPSGPCDRERTGMAGGAGGGLAIGEFGDGSGTGGVGCGLASAKDDWMAKGRAGKTTRECGSNSGKVMGGAVSGKGSGVWSSASWGSAEGWVGGLVSKSSVGFLTGGPCWIWTWICPIWPWCCWAFWDCNRTRGCGSRWS